MEEGVGCAVWIAAGIVVQGMTRLPLRSSFRPDHPTWFDSCDRSAMLALDVDYVLTM
jgi:hypothetical protein